MRASLLVVAAAVAVLGCSRGKPEHSSTETPGTAAADSGAGPAPAAANVASYTATDYAFDGPSELPAGPTRFDLVNKGKEPHHLMVVRIEQGRTFDSLVAVLKKPGLPPRWVHPIGGPNAVSPTLSSEAELVLTPGQYALACVVPTTEGVPHLAKGMLRPLTVTPSERQAGEGPADLTMKLSDYAFDLSAPLTAGAHVIRVENAAQQLHEVGVARLHQGKKIEDLIAWELGGRKGEAPGEYIGGVAPLAPGDVAQFSMTFQPGTYGFFCFVPDAKDGKPHVAHGMTKTFTVS